MKCLSKFTSVNANFLRCKQIFCEECYEKNCKQAIIENNINKAIECMNCSETFDISELEKVIKPETFTELLKIYENSRMKTLQCMKCMHINITDKLIAKCSKCNSSFCSLCLNE